MTLVDHPSEPRSLWVRARLWGKQHAVSIYALILTLLLGLIALAPWMFIDVPAGHAGVLWLRFGGGTVTTRALGEGIHFVAPWNRIVPYDVRLHNETRTYEALVKSGLRVEVEIAVRYRINPPAVGLIHKLVGEDYAEKLVYPEIASLVLLFASQYTAEEFYSIDRKVIQNYLLEHAREKFDAPPSDMASLPVNFRQDDSQGRMTMIRIENVLVSRITLPSLVRQAIERKIEQQQIMEEYDFRIAREEKERVRKRIEAEGIRDFQKTVAYTITNEYLRLRGIEATRAFADSQNSKTIIIGGRDGLPVILNTGDEAKSTETTKPPPAPAASAPPTPTPTPTPTP